MALAGIVVKNAIVLVDFIMQALREGLPLEDALAQAGQVRMRPIILTSATTILGLLPLGLFGGSMWAPMCFAVIFGLLVSTVLTMFVVPLLFTNHRRRRGAQGHQAQRRGFLAIGEEKP